MIVDIYNTDKKYNLITADPPWKYGSKGPGGGGGGVDGQGAGALLNLYYA